MKQMTMDELRAARARAKARGANLVKALNAVPLSPARKAILREASKRASEARRAQGDATHAYLLELAERGLTLPEAMAETGLSENGIRKNLRDRLGSGSWPPKIN